MFKVPEYQLTKEKKHLFKELARRHSKIDDDFLDLFEKRNILFIEDGTDLKGEISSSAFGGNPFDKNYNDPTKSLPSKLAPDDNPFIENKQPATSVLSFNTN